jgi:hypothetical protein
MWLRLNALLSEFWAWAALTLAVWGVLWLVWELIKFWLLIEHVRDTRPQDWWDGKD